MKRNMELVRTLLLKIEEAEKPSLKDLLDKKATDEDLKIIVYHLGLLINDAKLVSGVPVHLRGGKNWVDLDLTWDGHEFLNSIKNENVWKKVMSTATKTGIFAAGALKELGLDYAKRELGLSG